MKYKNQTNCRVCGSNKLVPYLDLGRVPLSNNLAVSADDPIHDEKYPLKVLFCEECGLSQLSVVIPPEILFRYYVYRSSISQGYIDHCREMAIEFKNRYNLNKESFVIDIAGNDGALLKEFNDVIGCKSLNIDPAENLVKINEENGVRMFNTFWGEKAAKHLKNTGWQKADVIIGTNVFAHVDNVKEFLSASKEVLKEDGVIVLEFPYLVDFIENNEFDTIYFEHLSYFSIHPITILCKDLDLSVLNVEKQNIHGGSVRVTIGRGSSLNNVKNFLENERETFSSIERYYKFRDSVETTVLNFRKGLSQLIVNSGYDKELFAGFAASAKGNTLLNYADLGVETIKYIVDETPEKIGKYSPGTRIPIVSMEELAKNPPKYLIILSWNFKEEIIRKCKKAGYKGKFIIPIPNFEIIE